MTKKTDAAERELRRKKVAANLLAGLTYRQMAEALGVGLATVAADVRLILDRWRKEQVAEIDDWLQVQLRRLDTMLNAIWDKVLSGDLKAAETALHIIERQAKLLGMERQQVAIVDWRQEAERAGIDPDAAYRQAVAAIAAHLAESSRPDDGRSHARGEADRMADDEDAEPDIT